MSNIDYWPELMGRNVEEVKEIILNDRPDLKIIIVPEVNFIFIIYFIF